jgi:NADP-dependent 3-hydroxy acid dehydrogenase YdfG
MVSPDSGSDDLGHQAVDIRNPDAPKATLAAMARDGRMPSTVIYAAGIAYWGSVGDFGIDTWKDVYETNVYGAFHVLRAYHQIYSRPPRLIIGISSDAAEFPAADRSAYHSSKAALDSLLESYRLEVRAHSSRVTVIHPGKVDTPLVRRSAQAAASALKPSAVAEIIEYVVRLPEDVEIRSLDVTSPASAFKGGSCQHRS